MNKKINKTNVLIIAPHCDDEVLGCGGYISKFKKDKNFTILYLTNANNGNSKKYSKELITKIRGEALKTLKFFNIKNFYFEDFPAPNLDIVPTSLIADKISNYIRLIKPDEVFIPFANDTHVDHQKVYLSSMTALRPFSKNNRLVKKILCYETLSETDFAVPLKNIFTPNYFVKINSKNLNDKIRALQLYSSQIKKKPHPRSAHGIKILSSFRGLQSNTLFAEAFMMIRLYA